MRAFVITTIAMLAAAPGVFSAEAVKFDKSQLVGGELPREHRPDYPREARARHETGTGVYVLHIDRQTGVVKSITVEKSTGHKLLDAAALKALIYLQFKPHTVEDVWFPMTFSMSP